MDAVARARRAQLAWARAGWAHRRSILLRAHDLLLSGKELLLDAVQTETGKTRGQGFEEVRSADRRPAPGLRARLVDRRRLAD
ncbi:aldehyde dehydrogenase family protein [Marisediminicola sp. UYEF4]|uniref:aldehyde dehydrogenase family protein n=1 Tax=Marisediminicola sp. UYEF4 TaxID=1756384 RepID=UPI003391A0D9